MNKFSDGFSDNSYEELLNQYAGESLGSKSKNSDEDVKIVSDEKSSDIPAYTEPVFNIDIKKKAKPVIEKEFDIDFAPRIEKTVKKPQPVIEKKYESPNVIRKNSPTKTSNTMEFKKTNRGKFAVSSAKNFVVDKIKKIDSTDFDYVNESTEQPAFAPKILIKRNGKTKIDFKALKLLILKSFKEHKQMYIGFGCCLLVSIILASCALSCINDVLAINRDDEETVEVVLPNDANTFKAVAVLDRAGLIKNSMFCNLYLKIMGYSDENYLPGVYYFNEKMGVEKMITRFKTSSTRGAVISVTVPEGYTIDQIFERLEKNGICSKEALYKTIDNVDFGAEYSFLANLENVDQRYHVLEGYMFPATYELEQGADPATVIRKFLDTFKSRWSEEYAKRAEELGMSVDEIITLASIVEKEGANKDQFVLVSSVLHNRLNRSGLYPTLECNSTQDYVTNTVSKRITTASVLSSYISEYSTYESDGLPPGAICNPGSAAIKAALYPESSQYYFFRHDKNGKIYMAENIEEHSANGRLVEKVNAEEN
ncbi:MAG: endolytic transglycosylase MltG [Clostridia bacterium]|nr:endolytic transglycosylase MltG [Clostridia bacterium]